MATDAAGNVYLAGSVEGAVKLGGFQLPAKGQQTSYVAKWLTHTQQFAWVLAVAGGNEVAIQALTVSDQGIYLVGYFRERLKVGTTTLLAGPRQELFVAKLTDLATTSRVVWAQQSTGADHHLDQVKALTVQGVNVYVAGSFHAAIRLGDTTLVSAGASDGFVAKLLDAGSTGRFVWARQLAGKANDYCNALAVMGASLYVAGSITDDAKLMGFDLDRRGAEADMFVAKLHDDGPTAHVQWASQLGGDAFGAVTAVAVQDSSLYVAGYCSHTLGFGEFHEQLASVTNPVVVKLRDKGPEVHPVWVWQGASTHNGYAEAIALHGAEVYVLGTFNGILAEDDWALKSAGAADVFLVQLIDEGQRSRCTRSQQIGNSYTDEADALLVTPAGLVYVAVGVQREASAAERAASTLPLTSDNKIFVAKSTP